MLYSNADRRNRELAGELAVIVTLPAKAQVARLSLRCVRTKSHKLTYEALSETGELYDLADDPQEMDNRWNDPRRRKGPARTHGHDPRQAGRRDNGTERTGRGGVKKRALNAPEEIPMSDIVSQILENIRKLNHFNKIDVDRKSLNIIHGSLDLIGDTESAIYEFNSIYKPGLLDYLSIYGLFQALQTQQDAVWALCGAIFVSKSTIKNDLKDIRRMRALTVAHPINPHSDNKKDEAARTGIISRGHLSNGEFGYMTTYEDGRPSEFKEVDLTELIERQSKYVAVELGRVRDKFIRLKEEHYKEFRAVKLAEIFHPSTDWMMGHVEEAIDDKTKIYVAQEDLQIIEEYLECYINSLGERGKIYENHIKFSVQPSLHCIKRLRKYFQPSRSSISMLDARIFADWLRASLQELKKYAESIDKEYENIRSVKK